MFYVNIVIHIHPLVIGGDIMKIKKLLILFTISLFFLNGCNTSQSMPKVSNTELSKTHTSLPSSSSEKINEVPDTTIPNSQKYTDKEIQNIFFGEWAISKLLGFSEFEKDTVIFPDGHDIIGNHIIINKDNFSSEGIKNYPQYQSKILNPTYQVDYFKYNHLIYYINESIDENSNLYHIIQDEYLLDLDIKGTTEDPAITYPSVNIMFSSKSHLVILDLDGSEFYLLEKIN